MLDVLLFALNAVIPILLLILLGYFLRAIGFFDEKFAKAANKLMFRVALPVLLFYNKAACIYRIIARRKVKISRRNQSNISYRNHSRSLISFYLAKGIKLF